MFVFFSFLLEGWNVLFIVYTSYLYFSKNGNRDGYAFGENWVVRLKEDLSGFDGEPRLVSRASQPWELVNRERNRCNEGAFVFKRAGVYYMTYSANDTGYSDYGVGVATAPHPLGPWTKSEDNPLMTTDLARGVSSPGHGCVVDLPDGESYFFYHGMPIRMAVSRRSTGSVHGPPLF